MSRRARARYVPMCIPGRRDDGRDDWWCVFDTRRRRARLVVGEGVLHEEALAAARELNQPRRRPGRARRRPDPRVAS